MKIVLLGANGQLGNELKNSLHEKFELKFFTRKELDIKNFSLIKKTIEQEKPKILINAAAYTAVDMAENNKEEAFKINDQAVGFIAKNIKSIGGFFIHYSTDYVFDGENKRKYQEFERTNPLGVYGMSKLAGENKIITSGCNYVIFRTTWVCGEVGKNFIRTIKNLSINKKNISVVNDQIGVPTSTKLISKVTKSLIKDIYNKKPWESGIYNLVPNGATNWYEIANLIAKIAIKEFENEYFKNLNISKISSKDYKTIALRPHNSLLNNEKLQKKLNYTLPDWKDDFVPLVRKIIKEI